MNTKMKFSAFFILIFMVLESYQVSSIQKRFNVVNYRAVGDGVTDDTQAFLDAWKATCKSSAKAPVMLIPAKTFLLQPLTLDGRRCKSSNITITMNGELKAPVGPSNWKCEGDKCRHWILFRNMKGLQIQGSGSIDGKGGSWWDLSCKQNSRVCGKKPTGLILGHSDNVHINGLSFKDSPQMHLAFERSTNIYASNLHIQAPGDSPNTDGIHVQNSKNIFINHSSIATGDDCISIGGDSSRIRISKINCGPGHGVSIGSLGKHGQRDTVELVDVRDVTFTNTMCGARIKTWQGGQGYARNITFQNIVSHGSSHPIIITQFYCDHEKCKNQTSAVEISNVFFRHISGTSKTKVAVTLACSHSSPCRDVFMDGIFLNSTLNGAKTTSYCENVNGRIGGTIIPTVPCLI